MITNPNEKMTQLIYDFESKKITVEQLNTECAYWFMDHFDQLRIKPFPTIPERLREYQESSPSAKQKTPSEFWFQSEIKSYLDQKQRIKIENESNFYWLKEYKSYLPEKDFLAHSKYQQKINEFSC